MSTLGLLDAAIDVERQRKRLVVYKAATSWEARAERRLAKALAKMLRTAEKTILERLNALGVPSSEVSRQQLVTPLSALSADVNGLLAATSIDSAVVGIAKLGADLKAAGITISFSEPNPAVAAELAERAFTASEATLRTIVGDVTQSLVDSYNAGLGIRDAATALGEVFDGLTTSHAELIARTEIQSAQNLVTFRSLQQLRMPYQRWWATLDGRTRDSHMAQHGLIIKVGGTFPNGQKYPGDRGAPPAEYVNCRCRLAAFIMPIGKAAPAGRTAFRESQLISAKPAAARPLVTVGRSL